MTIVAYREHAYRMLAVTPQEVAAAPQITPHLHAIARTLRRAGQPVVTRRIVSPSNPQGVTVVEDTRHRGSYGPGTDLATSWPLYLEMSDHADARKVLFAYQMLPKMVSRSLPIEAYCVKADVSPIRILEILTGMCVRMGAQASTIILAVNHPRVVQKTVDMALTDEGVEDRAMLHKASGFLPTPKGAQTTIQVTQANQTTATAQAAALPAPSPERTIRALTNRFNDQPALPAPVAPEPTTITDAEVEDVGEEDVL
jgi:hypothetical protein